MAYAYYWKKLNPHLKMKENATLPFLEEGDLLASIYNIFEEAPLIGVGPKSANFGFKILNKFKELQEQSNFKDIKKLDELEAEDIEVYLVKLWAEDFIRIIQSKKVHCVLILDTLEKIGELNQGKLIINDSFKWVEELIQSLANVNVVSFGREQLENEKQGKLKQFEVLPFNFEETCELLKNHYINNQEISKALFISTKGIPYYLDLAIKTYNQISSVRIPNTKDFEGNLEKVVERFVKYLNREERAILEVLSVPKGWDEKLYDALFSREEDLVKRRASFIEGCNFVTYNEDLSQFTMHNLMREHLLKNLKDNSEQYNRITKKIYHYNKSVLLDLDNLRQPEYYENILGETFYYAKEMTNPEEFISIIPEICPLITSSTYNKLLEEIYEFVKIQNKDVLALYHLNKILGTYYIYYSNIDKATIHIDETRNLFNRLDQEIQGSQVFNYIIFQINYYGVKKDYKQTEKMILELIDVIDESLELEKYQSLKRDFYNDLTFIYIQLGMLEKANYYSQLSLENDQKESTPAYAMKLSNGGLIKLKKLDFEKAFEMFDEGLNILEDLGMLEDREYFILKANQAEALLGLSNEKRAAEIHEEVLKKRVEILGDDHVDVAESYLYVTMVYTTKKQHLRLRNIYLTKAIDILSKLNPSHNLAKAYTLFMQLEIEKENENKALMYGKKSLEIRQLLFDATNIEVAYGYENLGTTYACFNKYEKAIECYNKGIKIVENQKDVYELEMFIVLSKNKGEVLRDLGLYNDAKVVYQKMLPLLENEFLDQADIYNIIGITLRHLKDYKGAEKSYKKALRIRLSHLPENHRDIAVTHLNLGITYYFLKAKNKEKVHLEEAFNIFIKNQMQYKKELFQVCSMLAKIFIESKDINKSNYYNRIALQCK